MKKFVEKDVAENPLYGKSGRQCRPYRRQYAGGGYDCGQGIQRI